MPGYDRERFIGIDDEDLDDFICGICIEVIKDPVITSCCRQTYCNDCITQWLTSHNTCPNDRKPLAQKDLTLPPRAFINVINKLKVKCNFVENGCRKEIKLDQLSEHTLNCEYNLCTDCGLIIGFEHNCINNFKTLVQKLKNENEVLKISL